MKRTRTRQPAEAAADADTMRPEYDFSRGVRGATAKRHADGSNVVTIDADLLEFFPDAQAVNEALRTMARVLRARPATRARRRRT